jgi:DhnA family fructose-bisphosphate aldolase class Ia
MTQAESFKIAVEAAGRTRIICSGGGTLPAREFLQRLHDQINISGCKGAATGRNIHQKETQEAVRMTAACHAIICDGASVDEAMSIFEGQ